MDPLLWLAGMATVIYLVVRFIPDDLLGDDDPLEDMQERSLVALRERYESDPFQVQLIEIRNLPERDPWRAAQ